jgi:hypothetical protein
MVCAVSVTRTGLTVSVLLPTLLIPPDVIYFTLTLVVDTQGFVVKGTLFIYVAGASNLIHYFYTLVVVADKTIICIVDSAFVVEDTRNQS